MADSSESTFDSATRVAAGDDDSNYDRVAIILHWTTAVLVLAQFLSAITWDYFPQAVKHQMESIHISLGVLLTAVILTRIVWRFFPGHQMAPLTSGWMKLAAKAVHYLLYLMLLAQAALGFGFRWAQGHAVEFFGLFGIPGPYGQLARPDRRLLHELHEWVGWGIVIVAATHALAALYHHYVVKDRVLERMLPTVAR
jgi:cytochrome b561